jgi:tetratricopeptide (TPR) repeat protein
VGNDAFEAGDPEAALLAYTRAIAAAPGDAAAWSNRAAVFLALRRYPQALHDAARASAIQPGWAKPRARTAAAHAALGEVRTARQRSSRSPRRTCWRVHADARALLHAAPPQHEAACRAYRTALKLDPSNSDYAAALAACQRAAAAAASPRPATQQRAPAPSAAAPPPGMDAKARGDAAVARGAWDAACAAYTAALAVLPHDGAAAARGVSVHAAHACTATADSASAAAKLLSNRSAAHAGARRFAAALADADAALVHAPRWSKAWSRKGEARCTSVQGSPPRTLTPC